MAAPVPKACLRLPALLEPAVGCDRLDLQARTLAEAFEAAYGKLPILRHHLALESGELRPHILCIHNGVNIDRARFETTELADGDEILIHQAISGG